MKFIFHFDTTGMMFVPRTECLLMEKVRAQPESFSNFISTIYFILIILLIMYLIYNYPIIFIVKLLIK